uniref:Uncharacterized protein n=1 Tax=Rhizophora mucronata TaxID=61149 RepID=A0A2P2P135_RHIMU
MLNLPLQDTQSPLEHRLKRWQRAYGGVKTLNAPYAWSLQ